MDVQLYYKRTSASPPNSPRVLNFLATKDEGRTRSSISRGLLEHLCYPAPTNNSDVGIRWTVAGHEAMTVRCVVEDTDDQRFVLGAEALEACSSKVMQDAAYPTVAKSLSNAEVRNATQANKEAERDRQTAAANQAAERAKKKKGQAASAAK